MSTLHTVRANGRVSEVVPRIEHALAAANLKIFTTVDQAAEARAVGEAGATWLTHNLPSLLERGVQ